MAADLDNFLKLDDQSMKESQTAADVAAKWIQNEILWQQAVKAQAENVRLLLNIRWDAEAHQDLVNIERQARQTLRRLQDDRATLEKKIVWLRKLMSDDCSLVAAQQGWMAFDYVRGRCSTKVMLAPPSKDVGLATSWAHPDNHQVIPLMAGDSIIHWARVHNYYPVLGGAAYAWLEDYLSRLDDAAGQVAADKAKRVADALAEVHMIEQQDWDRLKASQQAATK